MILEKTRLGLSERVFELPLYQRRRETENLADLSVVLREIISIQITMMIMYGERRKVGGFSNQVMTCCYVHCSVLSTYIAITISSCDCIRIIWTTIGTDYLPGKFPSLMKS